MKLYEQGVYLLHGTELVADGPQAQDEIRQKTGQEVTKEEADKQTMAYGIRACRFYLVWRRLEL